MDIRKNDVLIFEEIRGARTGVEADADPRHRWAVRVTHAQRSEDPLYPIPVDKSERPRMRPTPLVEISWAGNDALPFALCISTIGEPPKCAFLTDVSIARGNIVLVDHGRTIDPEPLPPVPESTTQACCECEGHPSDVIEQSGRYYPALRKTPITFSEPLVPGPVSASRALAQEPRDAVPAILLTDGASDWRARQDLLASSPDDRDFVAEIDNDAVAHLRFGDGEQGRRPTVRSVFSATYRVGCGKAGNVGAETISHLVLKNLKLDGVSITVRNPLPARGNWHRMELNAVFKLRGPVEIARNVSCVPGINV